VCEHRDVIATACELHGRRPPNPERCAGDHYDPATHLAAYPRLLHGKRRHRAYPMPGVGRAGI
jgi:hypothetical protein